MKLTNLNRCRALSSLIKRSEVRRSLLLPFALLALFNANATIASVVSIGCTPGVNTFGCNSASNVSGSTVTNGDVNGDYSFEYEQSGRRATGEYDSGVFDFYARTNTNNYGFWQHTAVDGLLRLDDLSITGPGGSVFTSVNLQLSGSSITDIYSGLSGSSGAQVKLGINGDVAGSTFGGSYESQHFVNGNTIHSVTGIGTQIAGGGFDSTFSSTLVTPTVEIDVGEIFAIELIMNIQSTINYGHGFARMDIDWFSPLVGQSVFNLEDGYTVNSASGLIQNNCFLSCDAPVAAPEPAGFLLIMTGFLGIGFVRYRLRRGLGPAW